MSDLLDELAEIDVQTWVVLAVGAATVFAQVLASRWASRTADRQAGAAELQAQAAQAALDRESAARLIAVLKMAATRSGQITLFNSGEHAAMDVSCWWSGRTAVRSRRVGIRTFRRTTQRWSSSTTPTTAGSTSRMPRTSTPHGKTVEVSKPGDCDCSAPSELATGIEPHAYSTPKRFGTAPRSHVERRFATARKPALLETSRTIRA
jgi:hypothetical protein